MKAAVYHENGPPSVLRYEDVPDPKCHPKGVVIRVAAVSIEGVTRVRASPVMERDATRRAPSV